MFQWHFSYCHGLLPTALISNVVQTQISSQNAIGLSFFLPYLSLGYLDFSVHLNTVTFMSLL